MAQVVVVKRLLAAASLNHSLAVPLLWPDTPTAMRTYSVKLNVSPGEIPTDVGNPRFIVLRKALLNPLLPPTTPSSSPVPIGTPFLNTSANRSSLVPTSSLFFRPIHTCAGPS